MRERKRGREEDSERDRKRKRERERETDIERQREFTLLEDGEESQSEFVEVDTDYSNDLTDPELESV